MKQLKLTFLLTMLMSMVCNYGLAYEIECNGFYFDKCHTPSLYPEGAVYLTYGDIPYSGDVIIPSNCSCYGDFLVKRIKSGALVDCNITSIEIPSTVTCIDASAIGMCNDLTTIILPNTITVIGEWNFASCPSLRSINLPKSITSIENYVLSGCTNLESITIPIGVTSIGDYAFSDCSSLTEVTVQRPNPLPISQTVFTNRKNATLYVPIGTKSAYETADVWKEFKEIIEREPMIKPITFEDENVKKICLDNWDSNGDFVLSEEEAASVTDIGTVFAVTDIEQPSAQLSMESFDEFQYFTGISYISSSAFERCASLQSIIIPSSVQRIEESAFLDCSSLKCIDIPNNVKTIGGGAFLNCSSLATVNIGNGINNIGYSAFDNCPKLTKINFVSVESICNTTFGGYWCPNSSRALYVNGEEVSELIIPNTVTSIGSYAFYGCNRLSSITIPSSVTSIGGGAFEGCVGLTSVNVSDLIAWCNISFSLTESYDNSYYSSNPLSYAHHLLLNGVEINDLVIPNDVSSIGNFAFVNCENITSITIPSSVTRIGYEAFSGCSNLSSVTVEWSEPLSINEDVFNNSNISNATLYVPYRCKAAYKAADVWKNFKEIVEYGVPEIEKYTLEVYGDVGIDLNESHLYDRDGNEYDYIGSGDNEFDEGSYIRISPFVGASLYIQEIIVNGESVGTWTEDNAPTEYVIESLSENTTVEFKTYLRAQWRTLGCIAEGPGKVEMYKNGNLIGTTSSPENYFSDVFECGDVIKLVLVPDAGSTLTQFLGGEYSTDEALREDLLGDITNNTYSFTFNPDDIVNKYGYLVRFFKAIFEGPEPSTNNTLSTSVPTLLIGKQATLSLNLTNEDELIAFEFDLQLPDGITIAKDEDNDPIAMLSSRASKHSLAVSDQGNGLYHFLCYSNTNKIISGSEGELLSIELLCDENTAVGTYQATVKNIIFSDVDKNKITPADVTFDLEVIEAEPGDVNNDGEINVMDVVEMVAYIMGDGSEGFVFAAADLYPDGAINVMDLVNLVDLIMNSSASNAREWTENGMSLSTLADGTVSVKVNNPEQYVASEFIVEVSAGQTLEAVTADKNHRVTCTQLDDSQYKVMTYSSANSTFNSDALVQLHISGEGMVNVHDALLVDENRKGVAFAPAAGGYTTGINQMENGKLIIENSSVYDLQGKKRDTSRPYKHEILIVNGKKQVVR